MSELQTIVLAGGCFWCTEAVYVKVRGVADVESGYSNGQTSQPSYEQVCTGNTGHAEVVKLTYDPAQISTQQILEVFFLVHDPTQLNRQGPDFGTQYRSVIFTHSEQQRQTALQLIAELDGDAMSGRKIVTQVRPASTFYKAEEYHQEYFKKNPGQGYCSFVVAPKVKKFREKFAEKLRKGA